MNKSKLGISTCMTAGLVFLLAILVEFVNSSSWVFSIPFIALVAFILYKEEDLWLKASALKAIFVVIFFTLVPFAFSFVNDIMNFLNFFLQFAVISIGDGWGIMSFISNIIYVVEKVFLIILAVFAFKGKTLKLPVIDNMINKHLN